MNEKMFTNLLQKVACPTKGTEVGRHRAKWMPLCFEEECNKKTMSRLG